MTITKTLSFTTPAPEILDIDNTDFLMKVKNITDVDEYLGCASSRFFGEGYKKVKYRINTEEIGKEGIVAKVSIKYPEDWSVKKKNNLLKPHISSVDALLVASHMCGLILIHQKGDLNGSHISSISIIAGNTPSLDLDNVPVSLELINKIEENNVEVLNFKGKVAEMKINVTVIHDKLNCNKAADNLLSPNYIIGNFTKAKQGIKNISLKKDNYAQAGFVKNNASLEYNSADIIDAFVSGLQVGQILLYELDCIERSISNNLWMRRLKVTKKDIELHMPEKIVTRLDDLHISEINNECWRSATIISKLQGIEIACSVAHKLPNEVKSNGC